MNKVQIIGISLIKNEDLFIEQAIKNVVHFCDRLIITDNYSTDQTWEIVTQLAATNPKIECHRISRTGDSHRLIQEYAGSNTWVFGVDGDEIYNPRGLKKFRTEILSGRYSDQWMIYGNVLNCVSIDKVNKKAAGYLAPPCRSMTKFYNFNAITGWKGPCLERMLGGTPEFKEGYDFSLKVNLHQQVSWDEALFRCLHTCFLRRSSKDVEGVRDRPNPVEIASRGRFEKIGLSFINSIFKRGKQESWKKKKYLIGDLVTVDVSPFFG